jgi:hypothetical protein
MAASGAPPVVDKSSQTAASTAVVASTNAAVADPSRQAGASTATANNAAPAAAAPQKPPRANFSDNNDPYGGNDPNSTAGARAFFVPQY